MNLIDKTKILKQHFTIKICHTGIYETYEALKIKYYCRSMKSEITELINFCYVFQKAQYYRHSPKIESNLTLNFQKSPVSLHIDVFQVV